MRMIRLSRLALICASLCLSCGGDTAAGDATDDVDLGGCSAGTRARTSVQNGALAVSDVGHLGLSVGDALVDNPLTPPPLVFHGYAAAVGERLDQSIWIRNESPTGRLTVQLTKVVYTAPPGSAEDTPALALVAATGPECGVKFLGGAVTDTVIEPLGTLTLVVRYTRPADALDRSGVVVIRSDTPGAAEKDLAIPIVVDAGAPALDLLPEAVEFSTVAPGETRSQLVRITNPGTTDLELRTFTFSGHPDFRFVVSPQGTSDAMIFEPTGAVVPFAPLLAVPPGEGLDVVVSFAPTAPGPATGSVVLVTNAGQHAITMRANAPGPCITLSPPSVQFSGRRVGEKAVLPVVITSCGDEPLEIAGIAITDSPSGNFSLDVAPLPSGATPHAVTPLSLPAHTTATFNVQYERHHVSAVTNGVPEYDVGTITITSNAPGSAVTLDVSAYATDTLCPTAMGAIPEGVQVIPQTTLHLFSDASTALVGGIAKRQWSVTAPPGPESVFVPSANFPNPTFEANVVGTYTFRLDVWDEFDTQSCVPWEGTVIVVPD